MEAPTILVIRFGQLGDVILTAAATRELRRVWPDSRIDFVVRQSLAGAAAILPGVSRVLPLPTGGIADVFALRGGALADRYDYVIDLQGNLKSRLLALIAGGAMTVGYPKDIFRRRLLVWRKGGKVESVPVWSRYLDAVERTGIRTVREPPRVSVAAGSGIPGAVAFAPGAGRETKRWPGERFGGAARESSRRFGRPVLFLGSAAEKDMLESVSSGCGGGATLSAGEPIERTASYLRDAAVLVTNDSGLLHLAESVGTPVIAIFGPTTAGFGFAPSHPSSVLLERDLPCRPCSLHGGRACPVSSRKHACMTEIDVDQVVNAIGHFV